MAANGAHNLTSASFGASESYDEKALVTRGRSASLPAVVSGAIPYAGPALGLHRRAISFGSGGTQFVGASAPRELSLGDFGCGTSVGLAGSISGDLAAGASGGTSTTVSDEESGSDSDSDDSGDLRFAGIVNENDSDVEDWDADNHIKKKQRHE